MCLTLCYLFSLTAQQYPVMLSDATNNRTSATIIWEGLFITGVEGLTPSLVLLTICWIPAYSPKAYVSRG